MQAWQVTPLPRGTAEREITPVPLNQAPGITSTEEIGNEQDVRFAHTDASVK